MNTHEAAGEIYPCRFPIKVIGVNSDALAKLIITVMSACGEVINPDEMTSRQSGNGHYLSITFAITAQSRQHIEQIYAALQAREEIKMVL